MLDYLIIAAMAATALVVLVGVLTMSGSKGKNARRSNILMRWRIGLQALAITLIMISLWLGSSGA
ncbi:MAG: twin transmembrane helix small protein [Sneathiella sp.]